VLIQRIATDDEVYCQFLGSELHRFPGAARADYSALVKNPDINDRYQNWRRRLGLFGVRYPLLAQLPSPLDWHTATLQPGDLEKLRLIRNCGWDDKAPGNQLGRVHFPGAFPESDQKKIAAILKSLSAPDSDKTLILIAQATGGPFTILDGNHRATAMMLAKRKGTFTEADVKAYVGVSPRMPMCIWFA
jgi:hypothetical protein